MKTIIRAEIRPDQAADRRWGQSLVEVTLQGPDGKWCGDGMIRLCTTVSHEDHGVILREIVRRLADSDQD